MLDDDQHQEQAAATPAVDMLRAQLSVRVAAEFWLLAGGNPYGFGACVCLRLAVSKILQVLMQTGMPCSVVFNLQAVDKS